MDSSDTFKLSAHSSQTVKFSNIRTVSGLELILNRTEVNLHLDVPGRLRGDGGDEAAAAHAALVVVLADGDLVARQRGRGGYGVVPAGKRNVSDSQTHLIMSHVIVITFPDASMRQ